MVNRPVSTTKERGGGGWAGREVCLKTMAFGVDGDILMKLASSRYTNRALVDALPRAYKRPAGESALSSLPLSLSLSRERGKRRRDGTGATRPLISTYRYPSTKLPSSASLRGCSLVNPMLPISNGFKLAENELSERALSARYRPERRPSSGRSVHRRKLTPGAGLVSFRATKLPF